MYEQIQTQLEREQEKRKLIQKALMENMTSSPNQMVSGRTVPYSPIQGLSKIAKALIYKNRMKSSDKRTEDLNAQSAKESEQSMTNVMDTFGGREEIFDMKDMTTPEREGALEADPQKAAIMAAQDPYTQDISPVVTAMMKSKQKGSGGNPYYSPFVGRDGKTYMVDHRTGDMKSADVIAGKYDPETHGNIAGAKQQGKSDVDLVMQPKIKMQTDLAEREAEKIIDKPKIDSSISAASTKTAMLGGLIDKAKSQSSAWTTGIGGKLTSWMPSSPASDLEGTLSTIKSNIGFDKLQEMRDNSPTGGALGQVSEFENRLLQAVWGDLTTSRSKAQFEENLDLVKKQVEESWSRIKIAYKQDYGVDYEEKTPEKNQWEGDKEKRYQEWKARQ